MEIKYNKIDSKDMEWANVLRHFDVQQSFDELIKPHWYNNKRFCKISVEESVIFKSYGSHLLTSQIADQYERIFDKKVVVKMVSDSFMEDLGGF